MKTLLVSTLLAAVPLVSMAQPIWRCGPDGSQYSTVACPEGRTLAALDPRPADDVAAARAQAARDQRLADTLRRERLAAEAAQRGNGLTGIGPQAAVKPASPAPEAAPASPRRKPKRAASKPAGEETWRAVAPSTRRTKG